MNKVRLLVLALLCLVAAAPTALGASTAKKKVKGQGPVVPTLTGLLGGGRKLEELDKGKDALEQARIAHAELASPRDHAVPDEIYDKTEVPPPPELESHPDTEITCKGKKYRLAGLIGSGGFGSTFNLAPADEPGKLVLKVCNSQGDTKILAAVGVRACVYEAEMMVKMLTLPEQQSRRPVCVGPNFIIMHHLQPFDLAHATTDQFRHVYQELVQYHNEHFAHNDIKAENLMADDKGKVVIIDFGVASPAMQADKSVAYFKRLGDEITGKGITPSLLRDAVSLVWVMRKAVIAQDPTAQEHQRRAAEAARTGRHRKDTDLGGAVPLSDKGKKVDTGLQNALTLLNEMRAQLPGSETLGTGQQPIKRKALKAVVDKAIEEAFNSFDRMAKVRPPR